MNFEQIFNLTNFLILVNSILLILITALIFSLYQKDSKASFERNFFANIKGQGIWGEEQLINLLRETLSPKQFELQYQLDPKDDYFVDAAVKLPLAESESILLPIDSKLPLEDYLSFLNSGAEINYANARKYIKKIESRLKQEAKSVHSKYIRVPYTTDFAIIFIPVESLYYLLVQNSNFIYQLRNEYRIILASPSSLSTLLNGIQISFKYSNFTKDSREFYESYELLSRDLDSVSNSLVKSE